MFIYYVKIINGISIYMNIKLCVFIYFFCFICMYKKIDLLVSFMVRVWMKMFFVLDFILINLELIVL